jgi:hypothetical protein
MCEPEIGPDLSRTTDSVKLVFRRANSSAWNGCSRESPPRQRVRACARAGSIAKCVRACARASSVTVCVCVCV